MSSKELPVFAPDYTNEAADRHTLISNKTKEMRLLEGRFPSLEKDPRVEAIFRDSTTGKIVVLDVDGKPDSISYYLGGNIDWEIEVIRAPRTGKERNFVGPFYLAGEIRPLDR